MVVIRKRSYQIDGVLFFQAEYCCLTHITPDHLIVTITIRKKYLKFEAATISKTMASNNCLIVNADVPIRFQVLPQLRLSYLSIVSLKEKPMLGELF